MVNWDIIFLVIFALLLFLFYKKNKSKFQVQGKVFFMYRTKIGLKLMEKLSKLPKWILHLFGSLSIAAGFLGMGFIVYIIIQGTLKFVIDPSQNKPVLAPVLPGVSIPGLPTLSFFHWIIAIFIVAVIHEFSHGFIARFHNIKIKSSGFAFLGPVLAAFVEPDEKQLRKKSKYAQLSVFSAGPFSNIITGAVFLLISLLLISPLLAPMLEYKGVEVAAVDSKTPAGISGITPGEKILEINNKQISTLDNFTSILNNTKPNQRITIKTDKSNYTITLVSHPENRDKGFLGVTLAGSQPEIKESIKAKYGSQIPLVLFWLVKLVNWVWIISIGIALFNLLPLGPIDGGRMFLTGLSLFIKDDKKIKLVWGAVSFFILLLILINLLPLLKRFLIFVFGPIFGI